MDEKLSEAVKIAESGDFSALNQIEWSSYKEGEVAESGVCEVVSKYPEEGFQVACSLMYGVVRSDENMTRLLTPVVCPKTLEKDKRSWKAVRKFVESPKTKKACLRVVAEWMRNPEVIDNFFVSNALIDILWRLNTPESLSEMTKVAEKSAAKGNAKAMGRIGRMYYRGKGYDVDLDQAEFWMTKAVNGKVPWAKAELKSIVEAKKAQTGDERTPTGLFRIESIVFQPKDDKARVVCDLSIKKGLRNEKKKLFFEVAEEYGKYLVWERSDAFVVLLLHTAINEGYNIQTDVPMSSDLYYNITEYMLPPFNKNGKYNIQIKADVAPPLPTGEGVGTGVSCGVDSLHAIHKFIDYPIKRYRLTHLCINDVGAFGNHLYWRVGGSKVRDNSYARARKVAAEVGLPLIETESNVANALRLNHIMTHTFSSLFSIMCMRKLWGVYYYASAGYDTLTDISLRNWTRKHPADYEPILLRMMNTPGLMFYSAGELETRMEKIADIANYDVARKHLFSCTWDLENCGVCKKCTRNLTTLDYLGKLSNFSESYNIPHYMVHREYHFWRMYNNQSDHFFKEICDKLIEKGDPLMLKVAKIGGAISEFDELWKKRTPESDEKAVGLIMPYLDQAKGVNLRMAKAYKAGRGVPKSDEEYMRCLEYCRVKYQEEVDAGF